MFLGKKQNPYTIEGWLPKWKKVKRLKDKNSICEVEKLTDFSFSTLFKDFVKKNNAGRFPCYSKPFSVYSEDGHGILNDKPDSVYTDRLISFNHKDKDNIFEVLEKHKDILGERFIPFMFDDVKNLFCIDKNNNHIMIVFVDTGECGLVTLNLETFVGTLEVYYE
jgi:hypothetical protein